MFFSGFFNVFLVFSVFLGALGVFPWVLGVFPGKDYRSRPQRFRTALSNSC